MQFLLNEILKPAVHRVGTLMGTTFASLGYFSEGQLITLEQASVLIAGFVLDLVIRKTL